MILLWYLNTCDIIVFDRHIEEDAKFLTAEALSRMTHEELEFHYFSAHDFDRNSKLDGLELLKVLENDYVIK